MDRIAVVTGAAGGMGRAISDRLLEDGLRVVGVDIDGAALLTMAADRDGFAAEAVDLTDPEHRRSFRPADRAARRGGRAGEQCGHLFHVRFPRHPGGRA